MKNSKRWLALLMACVLVISILPVASLATDAEAEGTCGVIKGVCDFAGKLCDAAKDCQNVDKKGAFLDVVKIVMPYVNEDTNLWNDGVVINGKGNVLNDGVITGVNNWFNDGVVAGIDNNVNDGVVIGVDNDHNDGVIIGAQNDFNDGFVWGCNNVGNDGVVIGCNNVGNDGVVIDVCHIIPTLVPEVPATCTETGVKVHYYCCKCGTLFIKCTTCHGCPYFKPVTEEELIIPALGHDWGEPTYKWSADHKQCTATRVCLRCGCGAEETETVDAVIEEKGGNRIYTADFVAEWAETQIYSEPIGEATTEPTSESTKEETKPDTDDKNAVPSTGDDSNVMLYVAMAGVSAALIGALLVVSKKKVH